MRTVLLGVAVELVALGGGGWRWSPAASPVLWGSPAVKEVMLTLSLNRSISG